MKSFIFISSLVFVTACGNGNPHISSVRDGIERIESPMSEECEEQLSVVQVTTDENYYQDLSNCQGEDPESQEHQQQQQDDDSLKWKLASPVSRFSTSLQEVSNSAAVSVRGCSGKVIVEKTLEAGTTFFGITTPTEEICEVVLAY